MGYNSTSPDFPQPRKSPPPQNGHKLIIDKEKSNTHVGSERTNIEVTPKACHRALNDSTGVQWLG